MILHFVQVRMSGTNGIQHALETDHFTLRPFVARERHVFDEADLDRLVFGELDKSWYFVVIHFIHDDAVDFQWIDIQC